MSDLLVVDDDDALRRMAAALLEKEGHSVRIAPDTGAAMVELRRKRPALMLLDVRMPGGDGFDFCTRLRADPAFADLPIIFLTSKGDEVSRVTGLEIGGDDYVVKPFSGPELLARVKAVLRRKTPMGAKEALASGPLTCHVGERLAALGGKPLDLTKKEFDLLAFFLSKKRRALSRALITEEVWGTDYTGSSRTVDTHVRRLRAALGPLASCLQTVEDVGYRWMDPPGERGPLD